VVNRYVTPTRDLQSITNFITAETCVNMNSSIGIPVAGLRIDFGFIGQKAVPEIRHRRGMNNFFYYYGEIWLVVARKKALGLNGPP